MKHVPLIIILFLFCVNTHAQKNGYEHLTNIPPPHFQNNQKKSKFRINGILLSPTGKHLVVDYGRKASTLAIFSFPDFTLLNLQRIEKTVELSQSYFSTNDSMLYVKEDRYAPDYIVLNYYSKRKINIKCEDTPRGCPSQAAGFTKIRTYTPDKKHLLQRSKDDRSILEVFQKK